MITYEEYKKEKPFIEQCYIDMADELTDTLFEATKWPDSDGRLVMALFLKQHEMKCTKSEQAMRRHYICPECGKGYVVLEKQKPVNPWKPCVEFSKGVQSVLDEPLNYGLMRQRPPKWNKIDERMLEDIIDCIKKLPVLYESIEINGENIITHDFIANAVDWLRSLKLNPYPQFTWEDKTLIEILIDHFKKERAGLSINSAWWEDCTGKIEGLESLNQKLL